MPQLLVSLKKQFHPFHNSDFLWIVKIYTFMAFRLEINISIFNWNLCPDINFLSLISLNLILNISSILLSASSSSCVIKYYETYDGECPASLKKYGSRNFTDLTVSVFSGSQHLGVSTFSLFFYVFLKCFFFKIEQYLPTCSCKRTSSQYSYAFRLTVVDIFKEFYK